MKLLIGCILHPFGMVRCRNCDFAHLGLEGWDLCDALHNYNHSERRFIYHA